MKHLGRTKKSAFTLIELLVVIAIIAILAAILFPVFAQAREKARAITCISNEKQMGLGMLQYVQDFDEVLPPGNYQVTINSAVQEFRWYNMIGPYIKNGNTISGGPNNGKYDGSGGIWACPDFPVNATADYGVGDHLFPTSGPPYTAGGLTAPTVNTAILLAPASTIAIMEKGMDDADPQQASGQDFPSSWPWFGEHEGFWTDTVGNPPGSKLDGTDYSVTYNGWSNQDCDMSLKPGNTVGQDDYGNCGMHPRYRHTNTCNVVFCDGHVKAMGKGKIVWFNNIYDQNVWNNWCGSASQNNHGECPPY